LREPVRYQNVAFVLLKNGTPVARLVPEGEKVCLGRDLARVIRSVDLAWNRDLKKARKQLKPQPDKWQ
jgi:antitoxin (DNA-binding transcriptional repressor) of toxin-antitoxin stability system